MPRHSGGDHNLVLTAAAVTAWCLVGAYMLIWGRHWFLDLSIYKAAGQALRAGLNPYDYSYSVHRLPYTYTPFGLFIFTPLSFLPFPLLATLWWLATGAALTVTLYLCLRKVTARDRAGTLAVAGLVAAVASLVFEPVRSNMDYGQIDVLLMAAVVVDICKPTRARGLLVGLAAAIKLTPLLFLLYFLLKKDWRGLFIGAGTFAATLGVAWLALPQESSRFWFHLVSRPARLGPVGSPSNQSWEGVLYRAGLSSADQRWLWLALGLVTVGAAAVAAGRLIREDRTVDCILVLALAELLSSPISWSHHWSWVALIPVTLYAHRRGKVVTATLGLVAVVAIAAPYWWSMPPGIRPLTENSLLACGALALGATLVPQARRSAHRAVSTT